MKNPYAPIPEPMPTPHAFYVGREAQATCKHCKEPIIRDRWVGDTGWTHYESALSLCYQIQRAEPQ